eukprot:CAMPEP_0181458090 /NCGR_PEP_ID=MMETSP1110-20121109/32128_1 /TAXON_ID=174948 /ORGANISM="Symbiodinium sp., Strain CCMP421" /LENGTH=35 /DNA_ID= /DNA_START= /DNA_END= /DNA_ORIENTATION=
MTGSAPLRAPVQVGVASVDCVGAKTSCKLLQALPM